MSLVNVDQIAYTSKHPIDKVVRVFTGSYGTSDLISRTGFSTAYFHRIPHNVGRPMFCEVMTSDDDSTYDVGIDKIAFSDSDYVYIFDGYNASISTVYYRVYCSWIDDYDDTNPSIETITYNSEPVQFDSRLNYQKIYDYNSLDFDPGTLGSKQTRIVYHNLNYTPNVKVYCEALPGEVWPMMIGKTNNPFLYDAAQDQCDAEIYDDRLEVTLYRFSNTDKKAWYRIYLDQ